MAGRANSNFFIAIFAVVAIATAIFLWRGFREERIPIRQELKLQDKDPAANSVKVVDDQEISAGVVEYKNGIFVPGTIKIDENMGCLLAIINRGSEKFKLGLSPHDEKGDLGVDYTEIPPGESILLDPRYRIERIAFHDHNYPTGGELEVDLGGVCKNF